MAPPKFRHKLPPLRTELASIDLVGAGKTGVN